MSAKFDSQSVVVNLLLIIAFRPLINILDKYSSLFENLLLTNIVLW